MGDTRIPGAALRDGAGADETLGGTAMADAMVLETTPLADYARIERAIRFLDEHHTEQPALEEVAAGAGLSPFHFQRLFTRWAGVSPKRFLQALTLSHARRTLAGSASVLEAAWEVGLSGPSRLHDLFVTHEAVTPGEFKRRGEGLTLAWGFHVTSFGLCLIALTGRGLCALGFLEEGGEAAALADLAARWPGATLREDAARTGVTARAIFAADWTFAANRAASPTGKAPALRLFLQGTPFQLKVWEALLRIPPGALATYGQVAKRIGRPGAARAVGRAVAENPIAFLIPCHRVIRATGALGDYRWGAVRKRALLAWEAGRAHPA